MTGVGSADNFCNMSHPIEKIDQRTADEYCGGPEHDADPKRVE